MPETSFSLSPAEIAAARVDALPRECVAILGSGASLVAYQMDIEATARENAEIARYNLTAAGIANQKEPLRVADQIWGLGKTAARYPVDLAFHFTRKPIAAPRNAAGERVLTYRATLDMPGHADPELDPLWGMYPIETVGSRFGLIYSEGCAAYALMYAKYLDVKHIKLYGLDYPDRPALRACCEFWLGVLSSTGHAVTIPMNSTLQSSNTGRRPYGYPDQPDIAHPTPRFVA